MNKKRIVLVTDSFNSGGAQKQLVNLANGLACNSNYIVTTVQYYKFDFFESFLSDTIKVVKILPKKKIIRVCRLVKFLYKEKPDVIISFLHGPNNYSAIYKLLFFWRKVFLIVGERNLNINKLKLKDFLIRTSHLFANKIVCNSYAQQVKLKPYFGKKLTVILNGTDVTGVVTKKFDAETYKTQKRRFIVSARVASQKNPLLLLEAINKLKNELDFIVHWYGDIYTNDPVVRQCDDFLKNNNLENYFQFQKSTNQIYDRMIEYDALILPSIYEGCPNAIIDAMICGLPVIASDVSDNKMYLNHQKEFVFTSGSVEDLVEKIRMFCNLPFNEVIRIGGVNIEKSREFFDHKKMTKKYMNLLF